MLTVEHAEWDLEIDDLRRLAVQSKHPRTRERFLALYDVARGQSATRVAMQIGRDDQTVHDWIHRFNREGPRSLEYRRSGGRPPLCKECSSGPSNSQDNFEDHWEDSGASPSVH